MLCNQEVVKLYFLPMSFFKHTLECEAVHYVFKKGKKEEKKHCTFEFKLLLAIHEFDR